MTQHTLITGGSGFIGSHLARRLHEAGTKVRVLDLVAPPADRYVEGVEYLRGDVRDPGDLDRALAPSPPGESVSAVYHLAAIVSVPVCEDNPEESWETNFEGTRRVTEAMERAGVPKDAPVVFASSAAVYGRAGDSGMALGEDDVPAERLSVYAEQKWRSELHLREWASRTGRPAAVFRFFNVYGPGQDPSSPYSGVISIFVKRVLEGQHLLLHGGGNQTRDFVSVHDLVSALVLTAGIDGQAGQAMNLGSGNKTSIRELADKIMKAADRVVELRDGPARVGDVPHSLADIGRAGRVLGWRPEIALDTGLRELVQSVEGA